MSGIDSSFTAAELVTMALGLVLAVLLGTLGYRAWRNSRITPEERERRRRAWLAGIGKLGDARLMEIQETLVFYSYDVRGVEYAASQDVSKLAERVPQDVSHAASVKYDPRNPANSIVVAEEWSGLRGIRVI
jgi:hypothetical protein